MNKRQRKYDYLLILQGDYGYGHGWEDLTAEDKHGTVTRETRADGRVRLSTPRSRIRQDLRSYEQNEGGVYRIIERRELREVAA